MVFFQENREFSQISMRKKVKEHLGFHFFIDKNTAVYFDSIEIVYISQNQGQIYHTQHV